MVPNNVVLGGLPEEGLSISHSASHADLSFHNHQLLRKKQKKRLQSRKHNFHKCVLNHSLRNFFLKIMKID